MRPLSYDPRPERTGLTFEDPSRGTTEAQWNLTILGLVAAIVSVGFGRPLLAVVLAVVSLLALAVDAVDLVGFVIDAVRRPPPPGPQRVYTEVALVGPSLPGGLRMIRLGAVGADSFLRSVRIAKFAGGVDLSNDPTELTISYADFWRRRIWGAGFGVYVYTEDGTPFEAVRAALGDRARKPL